MSYFPQPPNADWSPEQALAIYEWLHCLADCLWDRHEQDFLFLLQQRRDSATANQADLFDDDLPF